MPELVIATADFIRWVAKVCGFSITRTINRLRHLEPRVVNYLYWCYKKDKTVDASIMHIIQGYTSTELSSRSIIADDGTRIYVTSNASDGQNSDQTDDQPSDQNSDQTDDQPSDQTTNTTDCKASSTCQTDDQTSNKPKNKKASKKPSRPGDTFAIRYAPVTVKCGYVDYSASNRRIYNN